MLLGVVWATALLASPIHARTFHYMDGDVVVSARVLSADANGRYSAQFTTPRGQSFRAHVDNSLIVRLAPGADIKAVLHATGLTYVRTVAASIDAHLVTSHDAHALVTLERLPKHPDIISAVPNWRTEHRLWSAPAYDDPLLPDQWYVHQIELPELWQNAEGSADTTIVVVDSGCDLTHPDLVAKLDPGRDVLDGDDDPSFVPESSSGPHGTACAGIAAASTNNQIGIAGACPNCRIRCVRFLSAEREEVPVSAELEAFQFAYDVNAAVVSNSWGYVEFVLAPEPLRALLKKLHDEGRGGRGIAIHFAVGNDNRLLEDGELLSLPEVFGVSSVSFLNQVAVYTNRGAYVDVAAPTGAVTLDVQGDDGYEPGDYTTTFGGTSSACPLAAGIYATLDDAFPELTVSEIESAMTDSANLPSWVSADADGKHTYYGYGVIRPAEAWKTLVGPEPKKRAPDGCYATPAELFASLAALWLMRRRRANT